MIRGAIFDLDGTLLDSMSIWDTIGEDYVRSLGIEPRENLQETFATFTLEQAARYYQEHYGVALSVPEILRGIEDMVASAYQQTVPLKAGAADFLRVLKERGVSCAWLRAVTPRPLARAALRRLNVPAVSRYPHLCGGGAWQGRTAHLPRGPGAAANETVRNRRIRRRAVRLPPDTDGFGAVAVYDSHEPRQAELRALADVFLETYERAGDLPALGRPVKASGGLGAPPSGRHNKRYKR